MAQEFIKVLRAKRPPGLSMRFMRDLESGQYSAPKGFDVIFRYQADELKIKHGKPKNVFFAENKLLQSIYRKYPEARLEPVSMNSFKPPLAKVFALRQLHLIKSGMPEKAAFSQVEQELARELADLRRSQVGHTSSQLEFNQAREQEQLDAALQQVEKGGAAR